MDLLRLVALDQEDLAVISAHLQDAEVRVADLAYLPHERRFAFVAQRFDWETSPNEPPRRRLTGLHFERVMGVRCRGVERDKPDTLLNLIGVTFDQTDAPSGTATLLFENGSAIQLDLECVEAQMKDLGPVWPCSKRPTHDADLERA
ncbi:MAG TPA: DUF2948 family protein [Beijerinckiaceae bacterium]|nr:DUF2948 family protein [Beijerinckiaceae bacterium]